MAFHNRYENYPLCRRPLPSTTQLVCALSTRQSQRCSLCRPFHRSPTRKLKNCLHRKYMIKPSGLRARTFTANLCLSMTVTNECFLWSAYFVQTLIVESADAVYTKPPEETINAFIASSSLETSLSNANQRASIPSPFCPTKPNIDYRFLPPLQIRYLHVGSKDTACACVPQHNF
jgi:hypothetical protein